MAISKKGKRKIIHDNKPYLWFVKEDDDGYGTYLHIISVDKNLQLLYKVNQINDCFISPKISIVQSEKLKKGIYKFHPPLSDEFISSYNVHAILNWYTEQSTTIEPIIFEYHNNPFDGIDFKSGTVKHIENNFSREYLREDMLQVTFPKGYLLDIGWYGSMNGFVLLIIKKEDWENPIEKCKKGFYELKEATINAIKIIEILVTNSK